MLSSRILTALVVPVLLVACSGGGVLAFRLRQRGLGPAAWGHGFAARQSETINLRRSAMPHGFGSGSGLQVQRNRKLHIYTSSSYSGPSGWVFK